MAESIFQQFPEVVAVLSEKSDGDCARPWKAPDEQGATANRARFLNAHDITPSRVVSADLAHGTAVQVVSEKDKGARIPETDGLCTEERDIFLSVTVADCLPVFFYAPVRKVVGLVHAGWRGLAQGIIVEAVGKMKGMGCDSENMRVGIGPGIGACHYEVKENVAMRFRDVEGALFEKDNFLDLRRVAIVQLEKQGITAKRIEISPECTFCETERYFSYRRDQPDVTEAMMAVIGIKR